MDKDLELELIDKQVELLDAVSQAVAASSPAPIEGVRASYTARRRELEGDSIEVAEGDDVTVADLPDPTVMHEPGEELLKSDEAAVDANPRSAAAEGPTVDTVDGPGDQLVASDQAAQDANPNNVDSRGNVGDGKDQLTDEQVQEQVDAIRPMDDNEKAAPRELPDPEPEPEHVDAPVVVDAPEHDDANQDTAPGE